MENISEISLLLIILSILLIVSFICCLYKSYNKNRNKSSGMFDIPLSTAWYLSDIINSISSVMIAVDKNWIIKEWNIGAERFTSKKRNAVLGHSLNEIVPKLFLAINNHLKNLETELFHELVFKFGEKKSSVQYSVSLFPLFSSSGDILIKIDDISEIVQKENQIQHAQKMEMIGILSTGIAHDFNNVISGIAGIISLMKMENSAGDFSAVRLSRHIDNLESATFRASKIASQLLSFSKKDDSLSIKFYKFDLNTAIKSIVRIAKNSIDKSVNILSSFVSDTAFVNGSQGEIEQMLLNLVINAAHSMTVMRPLDDVWGGTLTISTELYENYSYEDLPLNNYWCVKVSDTGVGIDDYLMKFIFTPFFTTKSRDIGTGLGLSVSYNIVKRHGGFIHVTSEQGKGASFSVFIPVYKDVSNNQSDVPDSFNVNVEESVLVVDDEPVILEVASEMLSKIGCVVFTASDGYKAVEILNKNIDKIGIIVLDLTMPLMSGKETYLKLKEIKPDLKVLLVSGYSFDPRVNETMELGADMFLQKPYTFKELADAVKKISD